MHMNVAQGIEAIEKIYPKRPTLMHITVVRCNKSDNRYICTLLVIVALVLF